MTRCTAHMATFCSCRFKRDTLSYRLRRKVRDVTRRLARVSAPGRASFGTTGSPEFTAHWHGARDCWVIRRHGQHYLDLPQEYGRTYVLRVCRMLNGEK